MEADKIESTGELFLPQVSALPGGTSPADEGRIIYRTTDKKTFIHDGTSFVGVSSDIPVDTEMLFRSDVAIVGYSIITSIDDDVVYVTKGSAAGGEDGGTAKIGGTWTQPNHLHTTSDHTLTTAEMPSHRHTWNGVWEGTGDNTGGSGHFQSSSPQTGYIGYEGGGSAHNHGNTGPSATGSSWRPKGQNFTVQKRI